MLIELGNSNDFTKAIEKGTVLVDFYASWCGPCRMLGPVLEELAKEETDVTFLKVNVDNHPSVAGRFSVYSIPTKILFKDGKPIATKVGYVAKEPLRRFIKQ